MMPYAFSAITDLPGLQEQAVLPAFGCTLRTRLAIFPVQTAGLTPITFAPAPWEIPRFSLFRTDATLLSGFRLHEVSGRLFTDASIVGDTKAESDLFTRKVEIGQAEDLDKQSLDAPVVVEKGGPVLVLASDEPANYGSWLYRFLPKYLLSRVASEFEAVLVYTPGFAFDLLDAAGVKRELVSHNPRRRYLVRNAIIPSLPAPHVYLRPEIVAALRGMVPSDRKGVDLGERLYISRRMQAIRKPGFRVLINETELVERLREHGFAEFIPENHSFREQMAIFNRARIIVGCGGSNMFGCVFASNVEFIVDLESAPNWLFAHLNLFESLGCAYTAALGTRRGAEEDTPHVNWTIDVPAVIDGLRALGVA
ncbi:MAG TPA: glycosyltransferase family 61 protein [Acetobacteraceae bacterium]